MSAAEIAETAEELRRAGYPALADDYVRYNTPGYAVVVAGYTDPAEAIGAQLPASVRHWSGVFFWPFVKAEVVTLIGDEDGREPDDGRPVRRRPAKWPVAVEWFGTDLKAARARAVQVAFAPAEAKRADGTIGREPVRTAVCVWCGATMNVVVMEPIRPGGPLACRRVEQCQDRQEREG